MRKFLFIIGLLVIIQSVRAEGFFADTIKPKGKNPKVAVYLSLALPGAGQIYNGKWWKVPFIYAGLGVTAYFYQVYNYDYWIMIRDYIGLKNNIPYTVSGYTNLDDVAAAKDAYRYYRDLSGLGFVLVWALNAIDAYVDAEFSNFDVSPNLSFLPAGNGQLGVGYCVAPSVGFKIRF